MDVEEGGLGEGCVCLGGGSGMRWGVNVWHVFVKKNNPYILAVSSLYSCRTEVCIIIGSR